ncbi:MAG: amidohydrolase family protein [Anaerolineae bacterium]
MRIFDANCRIGRFNRWSGREPITPDDLLRTLDHYGIHEALVISSLCREYHPQDGNEQVLRLVQGQPRLHPAWAALPPRSRELPPMADLVAEMEERGVRALFLYPQQYRFTLDDWCVDEMLGPLAEKRVPLFICPSDMVAGSPADQTDWPGVVRLCQAFPELPVIVSETRILRTLRTVYAALDACPNLHLDLSALWLHHIVEFITREWGAHRLLFGSDLPEREPGATLGQLVFSDISEADMAAIAGGNLRSLLSWSRRSPLPQAEVAFPEPVDELHAIAREGGSLRGQGFRCAHGHLGRHSHLHIPDSSPKELIEEMDRLGVASSTIFANAGMNSDETYGNDLVAEAMRAYPGRFQGLVTLNPNRSIEEMEREFLRGLGQGMIGIKIHPYLAGYDTQGDKVEAACALAHRHRAFILNHYWAGTDRLLYLCRRYPEATFMTGHTASEAIPVLAQVDNLYVGSCAFLGSESLARWVEEAGPDRLLFGSDLSWNPIGWGLGPILYAKVPLEAKRLILGRNYTRLLREKGIVV